MSKITALTPLGHLIGLNIVVVPEPRLEARSWRERLFSRPWRPWKRTRVVQHPLWDLLAEDNVYQFGNQVYLTPAQYEVLKSGCRA